MLNVNKPQDNGFSHRLRFCRGYYTSDVLHLVRLQVAENKACAYIITYRAVRSDVRYKAESQSVSPPFQRFTEGLGLTHW